MGADYTLIFEDPPRTTKGPGPGGPQQSTTELADNMAVVAQRPGSFARIVTYDGQDTARTITSKLKRGQKARYRAAGTWEFATGPTDDGRYGVWAKYLPS